jgi:non-specific serine/threonine protein kinase
VLDLLTSLAEKSLVTVEANDRTTRFGLLETVREYARHRLEGAEQERVRTLHLEYFLAMADEAHHHEMTADHPAWLDRLAREHDNFRAALRWSIRSAASGERALRLAGLLAWFWVLRCHFTEGREWLAAALSAGEGTRDDDALARGLRAIGAMTWMQGDVRAAKTWHERALKIERRRGDLRQIGITLHNLGGLASVQGNYREARALFEQSLSIHIELGDRAMSAMSEGNLAMVVCDRAEARARMSNALATWRDLADWRASYALYGLGRLAYVEGDHHRARDLLEESLALARHAASNQAVAFTLSVLGAVACEEGDLLRAAQLLTEAVASQHELGDFSNLANSLEGCAAVALATKGPAAAASIWGHAEMLRKRMGFAKPAPGDGGRQPPVLFDAHPLHDRLLPQARAALADETAFDRAWNEGRSLSPQQAVTLAIDCMKDALAIPATKGRRNSRA